MAGIVYSAAGMRVVEIPRPGPPEVLSLRDRPEPEARSGDVLIEVHAAGVNFADVHARMGVYPEAPPMPFVPGYEVAGIERGTGRRVAALTRFGGYAEVVHVSADQVFEIPSGVSFEEAAAVPVNYVTAWIALMEMARVRAGETVVVHSAAGGVGHAAIQIAQRHGARVVGVVGSAQKAQHLRALGVEPVVRPARPPVADVVVDPRGPGFARDALASVRAGGRVVLYGAQEFVTGLRRHVLRAAWGYLRLDRIDPVELMHGNRGMFGLNVLRLAEEPAVVRGAMEHVWTGIREGWVRPRLDAAIPLERAAEAHRRLQERRNIGKVVLVVRG
jgi:NADPH:quinone reductase-like Zn-dependent oxidoreductase